MADLLHPDEALVLLLAGDTFVSALTRDGAAWQHIPLGAKELTDKVASLRRGLEVQKEDSRPGQLFDLGLAYELYATLLGPVADLIDGQHALLTVASGVLTGLPFHLLVTEPPPAGPSFTSLSAAPSHRATALRSARAPCQ